MDALAAPELWLGRWLFTRLLALIYAIAFLNALLEFPALLGERGLLPVPRVLAQSDWRSRPTLFHFGYSDARLRAVAGTGLAVSVALVFGLPQRGPALVGAAAWLTAFALYLSIVNVGQIFYGFGWESILLEAGFFAAWLGPETAAPNWVAIVLLRWLLLRIELGAGLIKLRGDPCWRDLTCLDYHHETQPLPGPLSSWAHHRPTWWHRIETGGNHVVQVLLPVGLFLPQPVAGAVGVAMFLTQGWLVLTGNFAWLNAVTMALALNAVPGSWLTWLPVDPPDSLADPSPALLWATVVVAVATAVMSWKPVRNMASARQRMNAAFNPFHLVGTYGAFGSVTRTRYEIVLEGADVADPHDPDADWRAYEFRGKPGDPTRRPPQVAPYHLRLDWLMWFAAFSPRPRDRWFVRLVQKLLEGDEAVSRLLRHDPFRGAGPRWVRARRYVYEFTPPDERRGTGRWWRRRLVGEYLHPVEAEMISV